MPATALCQHEIFLDLACRGYGGIGPRGRWIVGRLEEIYLSDSIKILDSMWLKFYIAIDMIVVEI
jgi:hypothetical protein